MTVLTLTVLALTVLTLTVHPCTPLPCTALIVTALIVTALANPSPADLLLLPCHNPKHFIQSPIPHYSPPVTINFYISPLSITHSYHTHITLISHSYHTHTTLTSLIHTTLIYLSTSPTQSSVKLLCHLLSHSNTLTLTPVMMLQHPYPHTCHHTPTPLPLHCLSHSNTP